MIFIFYVAVLLITGLLHWRIALLSVLLACAVQYLPCLWAKNAWEIIMWSPISLPIHYLIAFAVSFVIFLIWKIFTAKRKSKKQ